MWVARAHPNFQMPTCLGMNMPPFTLSLFWRKISGISELRRGVESHCEWFMHAAFNPVPNTGARSQSSPRKWPQHGSLQSPGGREQRNWRNGKHLILTQTPRRACTWKPNLLRGKSRSGSSEKGGGGRGLDFGQPAPTAAKQRRLYRLPAMTSGGRNIGRFESGEITISKL